MASGARRRAQREVARYGGNTSCVLVEVARRGAAAVRPRHRSALLRPRVPLDGRSAATACCRHLHWDHIQGLPFFTAAAVRRAPSSTSTPRRRTTGARSTRCSTTTISPPLFPIALDDFPGTVRFHDAERRASASAASRCWRRLIPHVGRHLGYRVDAGRRQRRLLSRPPAAARRQLRRHRRGARAGRRRRPADPRRAVHAGRVRQEGDWGHCTFEYAVWLAGEAGVQPAGPVPPRPDRTDDTLDDIARCGAAIARRTGLRGVRRRARAWSSTCAEPPLVA